MNRSCTCYVLVALAAACSSTGSEPTRPGGKADPEPADTRRTRLATEAATIVDAFSNTSPVLLRDGRVVFASNRDGSMQLYIADAGDPASRANKLLTWPQPIDGAALTPDGDGLVFASDSGGDEQPLLYRVGLDGKHPIELTGGEKLARDIEIMPAGKPGVAFYSARSPSATAWAIYEARLDARKPPAVVYRDTTNGFLVDVRRDGAVALIQHFRAWADRELVAVELSTGKSKLLYPTRGPVSIYGAVFAPDGRVIVATDGGAEQALVLALDPATGKELARHAAEPATARIDGLRVSPDGATLALALDAGNRTMLELVDGKTLRRRCGVELPLGTGSLGELSHDGARLTVTWSTPSAPSDVFSIDVATCKATPLRREARTSLAQLAPVDSRIVELTGFDGTKLPTNVHVPAHRADARLPVIIRLHGGPAGSSTMGWQPLARFFTNRGYAWVEPNVRGSGGFGRAFEQADNGPKRLDAFRDVETAARWVAAQSWVDPDRMIVLGESYGGYAVLMSLIRHGSLWRAGVDLFGLTDLSTFMASTTGRVRANYLVELGDPDRDAPFLTSISPLAHVDQIGAPLFVYAGANDPRVPRSQSDAIVAGVREHGVAVDYMLAPDEGHSLGSRPTMIELCARLAEFLDEHAADRTTPESCPADKPSAICGP